MRILGLIPARKGSKGVPDKNIKLLAGKPLLQYTSDMAIKSNLFSKVVLSTDSEKYRKIGISLGLSVPFLRPENLSTDSAPTIDVIIHTLNYFENIGEYFDAVCLLQTTSPFRSKETLNMAVEKFINEDTDSLISACKVPLEFNPHWTFKQNAKGLLDLTTGENNIISRRQDLPEVYHRDGSIYITKTSVLKNQHSLYGNSISYIETDSKSNINIDSMKDWNRAEEYVKN
jgi:CMP-N-acetylneuraminic acid synthetase